MYIRYNIYKESKAIPVTGRAVTRSGWYTFDACLGASLDRAARERPVTLLGIEHW
jgi:hypothetical protein